MASATSQTNGAIRGLETLALDFLAYLPSSSIAPIIDHFRSLPEGQSPRAFPVSREEEAVGIVGGISIGGRRGAIVMQDNGFGNSLVALSTFAVAYNVPLLIVANTRGGLGEYNSMIHTFSEGVPEMLRAARVPVFRLDRRNSGADWAATIVEAGHHSEMTHRPVVVLMDFWAADPVPS